MIFRFALITLAACLIVTVGFIGRFAYEQQASAQQDAGTTRTTQEDGDSVEVGVGDNVDAIDDGDNAIVEDQDTNSDDDSSVEDQYTEDTVVEVQYENTSPDTDRDLLESSGEVEGALPFMPGGGCPEEFPVVGADGCYAAP